MPICPAMTTAVSGNVISSTAYNTNNTNLHDTINTYCVLTDVARTVSATVTFSAPPVFSTAQAFAAAVTVTTGGLTVSAGGAAITGNSTVTGNLTVSGSIAGSLALTTAMTTSSTINGQTLAAATVITTSLTVPLLVASGGISLTNATAAKVIAGAALTQFRNTADTRNWFEYNESTKVITFGNSTDDNSIVHGAGVIATSATSGFLGISMCNGTPSGIAYQGALVFDIGANKLWGYNSGWRDLTGA